jgi:hypothetical protein
MPEPLPVDTGVFAFGEKLLNILDDGTFTATYKYAVLLGLIELCRERCTPEGTAPSVLTTRQLAEKIVEIYWPQASPFIGAKKTTILLQNAGGQAEILTAIIKFRERHAPDPSAPLSRARQGTGEPFDRLVRLVEWKLVEMPLPRLQVLGNNADRFIYEIGWDSSVQAAHLRNPSFDNQIRLIGSSGDYLIRLEGLLRPLIQRKWARKVAKLNREALEDSRLEEFLFGAQRIPLDPVRQPLRDLQNNRCFYCDTPIRARAAVDHFLPWVRHPDNGIENLVVTDERCNGDKSDFIPSAKHLSKWKQERFDSHLVELAQISTDMAWERHPDLTLNVARSIYLRLPSGAKLWHLRKEFVDLDKSAVTEAFVSASRSRNEPSSLHLP